jgi:hypothetical protein
MVVDDPHEMGHDFMERCKVFQRDVLLQQKDRQIVTVF